MLTAGNEQDVVQADRVYWLDNLRTFMIFLVIVVHAGGVYESSGIWAYFWIVDDPSTNDLSGMLFLVIDIFMMPILFFVSGFLAPLSVKDRNGWAFLKSKFKRLMIPWMIAALTLLPLYKFIFLYSRGLPQESWTTYFHWSNGIWNQNWLWFLPVLFSFNLVYLLLSRMKIGTPNPSLKPAVLAAILFGFIYCVGMDTFGLRGWTKTVLLDFQNERLLIYFMAFLLGALCFRLKTFDGAPRGAILYIVVNATAWVPVTVYLLFLLYPWFKPGSFLVSEMSDRLILWFSYLLSLLCLAYATIETFRRYQDMQGRLRKELSDNSYSVYIIHVIVMGGLALAMVNTAIPSVMKHLILAISTFVGSNLIVSTFRRVCLAG